MHLRIVLYYLFALLLGLSLIPLIKFSDELMNSNGWLSFYFFAMGAIYLSCIVISLFKNQAKSNSYLYFVTPIITLTSILHTVVLTLIITVLTEYILHMLFQYLIALIVTIGLIVLSIIIFRNEKELYENEREETIEA